MMANEFTSADLTRLMNVAEKVAGKRECPASEAVTYVEQLVENGHKAAPRRSATDFADRVRKLRVQRGERLKLPVFGEPAWDMMLDLMVARDQQRRISITDLCMGSGVPATTALRHVDLLVRQGVAERLPDARDGRRWFVRLSDKHASPLNTLVHQLQECA